jgi:hypothetical protein
VEQIGHRRMSCHEVGRPELPRHRPSVFGVTTGIAVTLLVASCHPSSKQGQDVINLDNSSNGHTISVAPGDRIDITLQTIGPGQYETPIVTSGSIRFVGEFPAGAPNPGGPRQLFRFEAVTVGRADITIPHTILEPPLPQTPPFAIAVEVR